MKRSNFCSRNLVAWLFLITLGTVVAQAALAQPVPARQSATELNARSLDNLVVFTKLFGYVRYFHPTDRAAAMNWEVLAGTGCARATCATTVARVIRKSQATRFRE